MKRVLRKELQKIKIEQKLKDGDVRQWGYLIIRLATVFFRAMQSFWFFRSGKLKGLVSCHGKPFVQNKGELTIDRLTRIWSTIHPAQLIVGKTGTLEIGQAVYINGATIAAQYSIKIGDGAYIAPKSLIMDHHGFGWHPNYKKEPAEVVIGKNAWIATNAIVMPGVKIGEGAVVAVGAIVEEDVPAYHLVGGIPAKFIRNLNES